MSSKLEERLTKVEQELELLKVKVCSESPKRGWISEMTGSFKDDPEFDEILRLGKELRDADRPEDEPYCSFSTRTT